ncbi:MAG TPA: circularly permuted type 2 ATP-grasp protein, partial [Rhodoblastus sp.]|nr:circularly permuted type 2 ATP-grasp protein [Rhodoblastus sp.]
GRWWILGDCAQAPSGAGHALENRLVSTRVFANLYRDLNVDRLAGFFREFRAGLVAAATRSEPRICLLTPGPYSQTYYEQAYLARYLGFLLVEGGDLVVRDDKVHVRTIAGLKRADALLRRIDADWCDPLELNAASRLGVPGLMESIRAGEVVVANMPGSGLVESRALLGYLQAMSRRLMGEDLLLPHIATWWCGDSSAARDVLDDFDNMAISGAFLDNPPGLENGRTALPSELDDKRRERLRKAIRRRGVDYVGQEIVRLSTTPAWIDGAIAPRPFTLRVYAAATPDGWRVMPGGFCRMSDNIDARALSMGEGVTSADVWVLQDRPVEQTTLLPTGDQVRIVRQLGNLPSRAADNLFWFGRYLERAEATLRLVRCYCARVTESAPDGAASARARLQSLLTPRRGEDEPREPITKSPAEIAAAALHDPRYVSSGAALARAARGAASIIRERLSQDIWQILGDLEHRLCVPLPATPLPEAELIDRAEGALHALSALSGLIQENFNRVAGWSFLDIGRRVERGISTCGLARMFADRDATAENLDVLLDLIDSQITYRSRYLVGVALAPVRDMALLDPNNPRSVAFQVQRINEHLIGLPTLRQDGMLEAPQRIARMLDADLSVAEAAKLDNSRITNFEQSLMSLAVAVEQRYFLQGSNAVRAETLKGLA